MNITGTIAFAVPILLILLRTTREPRWLVCSRYIVAFFLFWYCIGHILLEPSAEEIAAAELRDPDGIGDTGTNVVALILLPISAVYIGLLHGFRRLLLYIRRDKSHRAVA